MEKDDDHVNTVVRTVDRGKYISLKQNEPCHCRGENIFVNNFETCRTVFHLVGFQGAETVGTV